MTFDVVALGETMLSLIAVDGALDDASTCRITCGGAESNTCVALSRLGLRTSWVSRLGADLPGDRIAASLAREGVDLTWVRRDPERPTGIMFRDLQGSVRYVRAGSAAGAMAEDILEDVPVEEAPAVFVTGITALIGEGSGRAASRLLDRAHGLRVVDTNLRPGLWGSRRAGSLVRPLVERCDLLFASASELAALLGEGEELTLARRARELGPDEVVVTRGAEGAAALGPDGVWREHAGERRDDVDPVGAGDAFDAGYLCERLRGGSIDDALSRGAAIGAAVASAVGDTGRERPTASG
jgi:2-dehydro-3-deoxygluconokinase